MATPRNPAETGPRQGDGERRTPPIPDNDEYRAWVRDQIARRLFTILFSIFGISSIGGFIALYFGAVSYLDTVIREKTDEITKAATSTVNDQLPGKIQSAIVQTLVEKTELVKAATSTLQAKAEDEVTAYLRTPEGRKALLESISSSGIVETTILQRELRVAEDASGSYDPTQRAQALQLVLVFQENQTENKKILARILGETTEGVPTEDNALTNLALETFPFSRPGVQSVNDDQFDADAINAALERVERLTASPLSEDARSYARFLLRVPAKHLSKLANWLREHSTLRAADIVAESLLARKDDEGIPHLTSLLGGQRSLDARVLAVRNFSTMSPTDTIPSEARRALFLALWGLRTDAELAEKLANSLAPERAVSASTAATIPTDYIYYAGFASLLDEALARTLRADDASGDFAELLAPDGFDRLTDADGIDRSELLSLWQRRLAFDKQQGLKVEIGAAQALDMLLQDDNLGRLTDSDMLLLLELVDLVPPGRVQDFLGEYSAFFARVAPLVPPAELLSAAITRDAASDGTWKLLEKRKDWPGAFQEHVIGALMFAAEVPEGDGPVSERLLAAARDRLGGEHGNLDENMAAVLATAALLGTETRALRVAVFETGFLAALDPGAEGDNRLQAVMNELRAAYNLPDCQNTTMTDLSALADEDGTSIAVESGQLVRVSFPAGAGLTAAVKPGVPGQTFDLFLWNSGCTRAPGHIDEAARTIPLSSRDGDVVVQFLAEGKGATNAELLIYHDAGELEPGEEAQPITPGKTYRATPAADLDASVPRSYNLSADLKADEALWLATRDLVGNADTVIEVYDETGYVTDNDDTSVGLAATVRIVASKDTTYRFPITSPGGAAFGAEQGFTLRTFKQVGPSLPASADPANVPPMAIGSFAEIALDPDQAIQYVRINPGKSGSYRIETLAESNETPLLLTMELESIPDAGSDGNLEDRVPDFQLEGGKEYLVQVPASDFGWQVLRVKELTEWDQLGAAAAAAGSTIIGQVTDRPGYCYARSVEGFTVVIQCPPGY